MQRIAVAVSRTLLVVAALGLAVAATVMAALASRWPLTVSAGAIAAVAAGAAVLTLLHHEARAVALLALDAVAVVVWAFVSVLALD